MCGIVAVLRRPSERTPPDLAELLADLQRAGVHLSLNPTVADLVDAASVLENVDSELRGVPGLTALLGDPSGATAIAEELAGQQLRLRELEERFDSAETELGPDEFEAVNAALIRVKDACWSVARDRLGNAASVASLVGGSAPSSTSSAIEAFATIQVALSSIDRLEVRGRDSAGLHILVGNHSLDIADADVAIEVEVRTSDSLLRSNSMRVLGDGSIAFVYKAAAEIGELGDNVSVLRDAIRNDSLLHAAVSGPGARVAVLGHTRWASVGTISEANAHPLDSMQDASGDSQDVSSGRYVAAALNGDVDNFAALVASNGLSIPPGVTTDAKVIPILVSRALAEHEEVLEAFRITLAGFAGSVAIGAVSDADPDQILLGIRGSGQALYVGLADDCFVVASEPYGLVEEAAGYIRMDGDTPGNSANAEGSRGQIITLDAKFAGTLGGIQRISYDGTRLPIDENEIRRAQITTRDIDRGDSPHFLLKEITESPSSFRKTLRGRLIERGGSLVVDVGRDALPESIRAKLRDGSIARVLVIGQGTAAVAAESLAAILRDALGAHAEVRVNAVLATELSGFGLSDDMADTLVVAISQSGTTTDTNRTVDLVRDRGASVIAIVNRRQSDLVDRCDGVLYTSDGRDVEMSVASTKAFYAQVAASFLLAFALAEEFGIAIPSERNALLNALRELPTAMDSVLSLRLEIAQCAQRLAPTRRYWAVVGNGRNRIAANEVRIKCSELCYKSIACDGTEDKKHIDLSSEPLVLVCAAGLSGSTADDVAKELAIYRAHKAAPVAIVTEGDDRFGVAVETISVPEVHADLAFVLSAMVGHLFGYEAALAIDASARPLREARAAIEATTDQRSESLTSTSRLSIDLERAAGVFFDGLRTGGYDGSLEAGTAVHLASLLRYATGVLPLDAYSIEYGKVGTPGIVIEDLMAALTVGIEQLTRPIDAIKHQAKTVTVGISRSDETLLQVRLVREVLASGAARDGLSYRVLRTLVDLDAAVDEVVGYTRYRIDGDPTREDATIAVVDRGGIATELRSRTDDNPALRGTKQTVAAEREVFVTRGRVDGRTVAIVPEVKGVQTVGLVLLHLSLRGRLAPDVARGVLSGYRNRYTALRGAVTETEPTFEDEVLSRVPVVDLLTLPIGLLADWWRARE